MSYFFLEPVSFFEFLQATGNEFLFARLTRFSFDEMLPESIHQKCLDLYHTYCLVGGMPQMVQKWVDSGDLAACMKLAQDLLATFRDDFHKYGGSFNPELLYKLFISVSRQMGNKFVYRQVDPSANALQIKQGISLLSRARVFSKVLHTSGNGLPLGAESNDKFFKLLLIDTGLVSVQLGLDRLALPQAGSMKSLHQFMAEKNLPLAIRLNTHLPGIEHIDVKTTTGDPVAYTLLSIPLYLAQQIHTLLNRFV